MKKNQNIQFKTIAYCICQSKIVYENKLSYLSKVIVLIILFIAFFAGNINAEDIASTTSQSQKKANPFRTIYELVTGQRRLKTWDEIKNTDGKQLFGAYAEWYWDSIKAITPGYAEMETAGKLFATAENGSFEDGALYLADYISGKIIDKLIGNELEKSVGITDDMLKGLLTNEIKNAVYEYAKEHNISLMKPSDIADMLKNPYFINSAIVNSVDKAANSSQNTADAQEQENMCRDVSSLTEQALKSYATEQSWWNSGTNDDNSDGSTDGDMCRSGDDESDVDGDMCYPEDDTEVTVSGKDDNVSYPQDNQNSSDGNDSVGESVLEKIGGAVDSAADNLGVVLPTIPHYRVLWMFSGESLDNGVGSAFSSIKDLLKKGSFSEIWDNFANESGYKDLESAIDRIKGDGE